MKHDNSKPSKMTERSGFNATLAVLERERQIAAEARQIVGQLWAESKWREPGDNLLRSVHDYLSARSDIAHEFFMVAAGAR